VNRASRRWLALAWIACALSTTNAWSGDAAKSTRGTTYSVDVWTVDGGGGQSSGGDFSVHGTIGQPDAEPLHPATGGDFAVTGGFWAAAIPPAPRPDDLFEDGFETLVPP
jgi:hypothetical protein